MWTVNNYHKDLLMKMDLNLEPNAKFLDIGCGDGKFSEIISNRYKVQLVGADITINENWKQNANQKMQFLSSSIFSLPFKEDSFEYIFLKDILHHIDEPYHDEKKFQIAFNELKRVCKPHGKIIILEANRYNPISYFYMVRIRGHDHLSYNRLTNLIKANFNNFEGKSFESHVYPSILYRCFKIYEKVMDKLMFMQFRMYTLFVIDME